VKCERPVYSSTLAMMSFIYYKHFDTNLTSKQFLTKPYSISILAKMLKMNQLILASA